MWSELVFVVLHTPYYSSGVFKEMSHTLPYVNSVMSLEVPNRDFVRRQDVFLHMYSKAFPMLWEMKIISSFYMNANFKLSFINFILVSSILLLWAQCWYLAKYDIGWLVGKKMSLNLKCGIYGEDWPFNSDHCRSRGNVSILGVAEFFTAEHIPQSIINLQ